MPAFLSPEWIDALDRALAADPAIARLSEHMDVTIEQEVTGGPHGDVTYHLAFRHGTAAVRALLERGLWDDNDYRLFYNVNYPPVPAADVKGLKVAAQGFRRHTAFGVEPHVSPSGRKFLWIKGGPQHLATLPGTDAAANLDGWISVTPMRADLTAHDALASLRDRLE